jgi:hypothetical protein
VKVPSVVQVSFLSLLAVKVREFLVLVVHQWKHQSLDRQSKLVQSVQVVVSSEVVVVELVRYFVVLVQVEVHVEVLLA